MRLLLLLVLAAGVAWFAPQFSEDTEAPCQALEVRIGALVERQTGQSGPMLQGLLAASRGALANAYVRERFPGLPAGPACVVAWWKLKVDPDLTTLLPPKQ